MFSLQAAADLDDDDEDDDGNDDDDDDDINWRPGVRPAPAGFHGVTPR